MKYIRFYADKQVKYGVLEDNTIQELSGNYLSNDVSKIDSTYDLSEVELLSPVDPGKIVVIGLNYSLHAKEMGREIPDEPMMFMVAPSAVVGDGDAIKLPYPKHRNDYEAELAIVIGREAKNVKKGDAFSYIFGYTIANDVSDRDLQKKDGQFTRAKSFDTFKPLGPVISTDVDADNLEIKLTLNGEVKQDSNTNDFIHDIQTLIEKVTEVMTLNPGDVILTGTPSGVGPLNSGDEVEIEIEGIGKLRNKVTV